MKRLMKQLCLWTLILTMVLSGPTGAFAQVNYENLTDDKAKIVNNEVPVKPAKLGANETAADLIKNPEQPAIYTLRTDFKVQRGEKYYVDYQPYVASVGAAATQAEKDKVKKTIDLPDLAGYDEPQDNFTIDYDTVKDAADGKGQTGDKTNGIRYQANEDFRYKAKSNKIKIKHVFQGLEDFTKYTNPDGSLGDENALFTTQQGNTGSTMEVSPLNENDPNRKGFVPEADSIIMQVPENATNFILEYRYNRAHYDVVFDTQGGTALPARTLYFGQVMPKIADADVPTKVGGDFLGWKPSVELKTKNGTTFKANEIIKVGTDASKNLDANLLMPASKVTFTAVWKDKEKADYAVQFWAEKADHADGASLADKYDYIGTRVYKDQNTGSRPDLDNEPVKDIVFPDLDQARLNKIWAKARFNRRKDLYLNKFYVYNQDLTHDQNKDPVNVNLVKSVDSTGKTVYNIYYDRQVYDLYFTKSNAQPAENTFYPEIWGYDEDQGGVVKKGGPGKPYHYQARFNEMMYKWPNDAKQTKGFSEGMQSFGWGPNYADPHWPLHLDTPPYRLNADEFLDMTNYDNWGGYVKTIDKGDGSSINLNWFDYKILSFGIKQEENSMPHHMDFWMDGFKDDETIIRYDLYRYKADTNSDTYAPRYPRVQGFTGKRGNETPEYLNSDGIDEKNDERAAVTPFPAKTYTDMYGARPLGEMKFIKAFFNNADDWGDPDGWDGFDTNGYLKFEYSRNKYPLRFNYDPSKIKGDNEFGPSNSLKTFYEFPLKALSPDADTEESYNTENPKNILDNPEKLKELGLTDLVFNDSNDGNKLKVKRPDNLSDQMVFKGWALDPAGTKLIWENPGEIMPNHAVNLYAKWGEPDYKWKVTFDPNGGTLRSIKEENLTTSRKKIQEGDIGQEEINTYAKKEANDGDKQVFTVIQRQKLVEPKKPTRKGYDFMGWEVIRYKKDATTGDYTNEIDNSYRDTYKVPELYSFGNDVVAPVYLKAIWVPNDRVDVDVIHHILSVDLSTETKTIPETLHGKRAGYLVATTGDKQSDELTLVPHEELSEKLTGDLKKLYEDYNKRVNNLNNSYFQTFRVEPEKIDDGNGNLIDNPKLKDNVFHFFYRPFRTRDYKVNYIDERFKGKTNEAEGAIIGQEKVSNGNRHYDARNYRPIPGWKLVSAPQQQLFFDVNEKTNEFLGINGTGKDEITFYYKDVRVIEVPNKDDPVPDGYVRVTYKADKGGAFTDKDGNSKTELYYDVIKGLKSDLLPVPEELGTKADGTPNDKVEGKYYITPETGKKFTKWDKSPLLNKNTIINEGHTFTAYFEWSGLTASGLVKTEAYKDPNGKWTNDFAPKIEDLKKQLVWKEKDVEKPLPAGATIKLYDEAGKEITKDDQVYALVNEKKAADKDELVRTVNIKAKVTFTDGKEPQELDIPITVYKNVYEALNKAGDKPLFLKEAEGKEAKDGGLKDVTGDYVMVTVKASKDFNDKDDKIYWVNKNAWVEIPEVKTDGSSTFVNWTADKDAQNENGIFDFSKRHKFTENTVISPSDAKDVVEQTDPNKKPDLPSTYVKVIVKTTDNATDATKFEKTFWVNPTKEVPIDVTNPTGKTVAADPAKVGAVGYTMNFSKWETEDKAKTWTDKIVGQFENETTIVAKYSVKPEVLKPQIPTSDTVHTPQGKTPTVDELKAKITPPEGKTIKEVKIVAEPDVKNPGKSVAKVIVEYTDGSSVGTNEKPLEIPVEVHKPIVKADPLGNKPKEAMENYVKVIFKAGTGGTVSGDLIYYVSPEVEVDMTDSANAVTKTPSIGYTANGGTWSPEIKAEKITEEKTYEFNFVKSKDIVEKTDDPNQVIPKGYVKVIFRAAANGKLEGGVKEKIYYVNPKAGIKLVELADGQTAGEKELAVPKTIADKNFSLKEWIEPIDKDNPITGNREHVAHFAIGQVTLTYDANGAEGEVPAAVEVGHGTSVRLARPEGLSKDNATFAGWKIGETTYQAGEEVTLNENTTATAQWKANSHTVTFNTMGGGYIPRQTVEHGTTIGEVTPPTKDGFTFTGWTTSDGKTFDPEKDPVNGDITLVAKYVLDVIPQTGDKKPDTVPEGFVEVKFVPTDNGTMEGPKSFWVNQKKAVTIPVKNPVGKQYFSFKEWKIGVNADGPVYNPSTPTKFTDVNGTTITATYDEAKNIIPYDPSASDPMVRPDGYVRITFAADPGLKLTERKAYYVKKNSGIKLGNTELMKPNYTEDTGYKFNEWDQKDNTEIKEADIVVTAKATELDPVIPEKDDKGNPNEIPTGYITVKFSTEEDGKIKGTNKTEKIVYVNPNKAVVLKGQDPEVTPNTGFTFAGWDTSIQSEIKYHNNDVIKAKYNAIGDVIPQGNPNGSDKPEGYLTVTFAKGEHGELSGTTVYYVKLNKEVTVPAPTVTPATGYVFKKWDQALTQTLTKDTTITAQYGDKPADPRATSDYVFTELGVLPGLQDYKDAIKPPAGKSIKDVVVVRRPDVNKPGKTSATVLITYTDGTTDQVSVPVFVQKKDTPTPDLRPYPVPGDCNNACEQPNQPNQPNKPNQPNQPNVGKDALNTTDHYQYLIGYPDGNFGPNRGMTRAEAATMFTRLLRERPIKGQRYYSGLSDIHAGDWYANTVGYAVQRGIVSGYPDGSFKPNKPITRAEFAAIASRFDALAQGNAIAFSDLAPSHWGYNAIRSAATKGWISGYPDNTFRPEQAITRAEVTAITNRMLNRHADLYWIDAHRSEVIRFGDVKRSDWYFEPIMEATMGHDFIRDRDMKTEHWTGLNGKSFI